MIKEAIGVGKTPEEALENAKVVLDAPFEADVKFEILEMPKKKTLGIFGKETPAKVRAYYEAPDPVEAPKPVKQAKAPKAAPAPAPAAAPVAGGETVASPMPGSIIDVRVAAGQAVKSGDILIILEAMKMENEIVAPRDGTVAQVLVTKGSSVDTGAALVVLS